MSVSLYPRHFVRAAAIAVAILLAPASLLAQEPEPTEAQMREAVEQWFGDLHAQYREIAQACVGPLQERTLPPDICAKICASPTNCLSPFSIRNFRKGSCQPPATAGQVHCSFTADVITANPAIKEAGATDEGIFMLSDGNWRFIGMPSR